MKKNVIYKISILLLFLVFALSVACASLIIGFETENSVAPTNAISSNYSDKNILDTNTNNNISVSNRDISAQQQAENCVNADFKLFGIFPFNSSSECEAKSETVYLGGFPLGINISIDGIIITSKTSIVTSNGIASPTENCDIVYGDILYAINNIRIVNISDISEILNNSSENNIKLTIKRGNEMRDIQIVSVIDAISGKRKIGLVLQDSISGIGTMTFINPQTKRYSALGHPIKDYNGSDVKCLRGTVYNAEIQGVVKGQSGKPGSLNGTFNSLSQGIGNININNDFGIFGNYSAVCKGLTSIELADRNAVTPGKAYIVTTINGGAPKPYEIQIIKVNKQSQPKDKSMVIRVVSPELLQQTGGIVQGMSGSPIIQNNKLVGAVTHVFISDPTKGYGLFADWMK